MKTKHKLKLLKELRESSKIDYFYNHEYKRILNELISESKEPTQKPEIETKPEPITETFEVGEVVEILEPNIYKLDAGTQLKVIRHSSWYYTCELNNSDLHKQDYFLLPSEIKKIPIQKDNPKEFKVGDKVRVIRNLGTILEIDTILTLNRVEPVDDWYLGMDKDGIGYQLRSLNIEHI